MPTLYYLGPQGSFTHQATLQCLDLLQSAQQMGTNKGQISTADTVGNKQQETLNPLQSIDATWLHALAEHTISDYTLQPCDTAEEIFHAIQIDKTALGVVAFENNVEGYVVPNLDALLHSEDIMAIQRLSVHIEFQAFVNNDIPDPHNEFAKGTLTEIVGHPHGLAQCHQFITDHNLTPISAVSNAAACRDIKCHQIAIAPATCASIYPVQTLATNVQDYAAGITDFLLLASRSHYYPLIEDWRYKELYSDIAIETVIAFIPLSNGAGVLANALDIFRDAGLNMTSFISRPIKGCVGTYSFIATVDAAPWEQRCQQVLDRLNKRGDWIKTLALYPRPQREYIPASQWALPVGGYNQATSYDGNTTENVNEITNENRTQTCHDRGIKQCVNEKTAEHNVRNTALLL